MFALLTILALLVAACGGSTASPSASASAAAGKADYKACLSLDTGGPTDKNFNQSAYEGLQALEKEGFKTAYTTAVDDSSYAPNIQQLIDQGCNTVIAVGYNQGTALVAAVKDVANAKIAFGWVDSTWDETTNGKTPANFTGLDFQIDEASMLAAYLAAGISKTHVIATYGGAPYPGVTRFMDGWVAGAHYYAKTKGVATTVLGWTPGVGGKAGSGTFNPSSSPFNDVVFGKTTAEGFVGQKADVVHAVAGTTGIRFPSHSQDAASFPYEFDVPMFFHDRQFDPQGVDFFPLACLDGAIGDKLTVNGTIQPLFKVQPRKYRIRMYNGGPSRFYWWWMRQGAAGSTYLPMTVIANCGNLLPRAVDVTSFKQGVAERFDLIIDFSKFKAGTEIFMTNRAEQDNGRGPTGKLLATGNDALKFIVEAARPGLTDASTKIVNGTPLRPLPDPVVVTAATKTKEWVWGRGNGGWVSNGVTFDRFNAPYEVKEGTGEVWIHKNGGGSWSHPLHVHYEEGRILNYNGAAQPDPTAPTQTGRKDVYRIDPSATITTAMRFRDYKGIYPMHCHNVVHEDHGMMAMWKIV